MITQHHCNTTSIITQQHDNTTSL